MPGLPRDSAAQYNATASCNSTMVRRNPTGSRAQILRASMATESRGIGTSRGTGATRRGSVLIHRSTVSSGTEVIRGVMPTRGQPVTRGQSLSRGPRTVPRGGGAARGPSSVPLGACALTHGPSAVTRGPSASRGPMASVGPTSVTRGPSVPCGPRVTPRGGTVARGGTMARGASTVPRGPTIPRGPGRLARGPVTPRGPRVTPRGVTIPRGPSLPQGTALSGSIQQALIEKFWVALMVYDTTAPTGANEAMVDSESQSESDSDSDSESESDSDNGSAYDSDVSWQDAKGGCALTNRRDLFSVVMGKKRVRFVEEVEVMGGVEDGEEEVNEEGGEEKNQNTEKQNEEEDYEDKQDMKSQEEKETNESPAKEKGNLRREDWEKDEMENLEEDAQSEEKEEKHEKGYLKENADIKEKLECVKVKEEAVKEKEKEVKEEETKQETEGEEKQAEGEGQETTPEEKTAKKSEKNTEDNGIKDKEKEETELAEKEERAKTMAEEGKTREEIRDEEGVKQEADEGEKKDDETGEERKKEDVGGGVDDTCLEECLKMAILEVVEELPEGWLLVRENTGELVSSVASLVEVQPRPLLALAAALTALTSAHSRRPCDKGAITVLHNAHLLLYVALKLACTRAPPPFSPDTPSQPRHQKLIVKALEEVLNCEGSFDRLMVVVLLGGAAPGRGCGWHYETEEESEKIRDLRFILDYIRLLPQCRVSEVVSAPLWWCGSSPVVVAALADCPGLLLTLLQYGAGGSNLHHYHYSKCCTNGVYLAITYLVRRLEGQLCPPFSLDPMQDSLQNPPRDSQQEPPQDQLHDKLQGRPRGAPTDLLARAGQTNTATCLRYLLRAVPRVPAKMLRDQLLSSDPPTLLPRRCCLDPPSLTHLARVATRDLLRARDLLPHVLASLPVPQTLRDYLNLLKD